MNNVPQCMINELHALLSRMRISLETDSIPFGQKVKAYNEISLLIDSLPKPELNQDIVNAISDTTTIEINHDSSIVNNCALEYPISLKEIAQIVKETHKLPDDIFFETQGEDIKEFGYYEIVLQYFNQKFYHKFWVIRKTNDE